ncbi:hypothetical protein IWZ03DRAFT_365823 [Phyllosticta citriasiana]|uniref:Secreted protein n=1 Tax=Phyllosticta citriasiana TaxID=595635 RepID=A0ABR1L2L4_9PEZI
MRMRTRPPRLLASRRHGRLVFVVVVVVVKLWGRHNHTRDPTAPEPEAASAGAPQTQPPLTSRAPSPLQPLQPLAHHLSLLSTALRSTAYIFRWDEAAFHCGARDRTVADRRV